MIARLISCAMLWTLLATASPAQDARVFTLGDDAFVAGQTVTHDSQGSDDLFVAAQRVVVEADITGSLHVAGQTVSLLGATGGDVYALGQDLDVQGAVTGDASLIGQTVTVSGELGGDLRAAGSNINILAPVGGTAILAGEVVRLDAPVASDMAITAERAAFGTAARIGGTLTIFEEEVGDLVVPPTVIPPDRITRVEIEERVSPQMRQVMPSAWGLIGRFLGGVVLVTLVAALIAAVIPERLAEMRRGLLDAPFRTLWIGFLAQSALVGAMFLVAVTLIGLILVPGILLISAIAAIAGYIVGAYAFGVGLMLLAGRLEPDSLAERALAAAIGALVAGLLGLIPFLGWLFILALSLAGLGAIVQRMFRPSLYSAG